VTDPSDVDSRIKLHPNKGIRTTEADTITQTYALTTVEDDTTAKAPKLKLLALEGDIIPVDKEFILNGNKGLEFSGRSKTDGIISIGRYKLAKNTQIVINDIVLDDASVGEKHCMIKYNPNLKRYFLKDQGEGSGTFVKVQEPAKLRNGSIVSFSDSHMMINITQNKTKENNSESSPENSGKDELVIRFLDGPKATQVFKFSSQDEVIKIGRMNDCQIIFEGNNLSRYQCSLVYKEGFWYIYDGFNEKQSTNGTWIFVDHFYEIFPGTVIKIGQTLFRADII